MHENDTDPCFFCPWQGMRTKRSNFELHLSKHLSREGDFKCNFCEKTFYNRRQKFTHDETHEKIADKYQCKFCTFKTHSYSSFSHHNCRKNKE